MEVETTPLPFEPTSDISKDSDVLEAYNVAVRFETGADSEDHKRFARVLGYLLRELPQQKGRRAVAARILRCNEKLNELAIAGDDYSKHFIGLFKQRKTYSASSPSASRAESQLKESLKSEVQEATRSRRARDDTLRRDGFCCVVTGAMDTVYYKANHPPMPPAGIEVTENVHIFPQCLTRDVEPREGENLPLRKVFSILAMFGYTTLSSELRGIGIHRLENLLTMTKNCHALFDRLDLWLEPDENAPNTYAVCTSFPRGPLMPKEVTFTPTDAGLPLPSRDYLAIHACCARVAHLSGVAEHIDKVQRDRDELCVLAKDGSSAKLLKELLSSISYYTTCTV